MVPFPSLGLTSQQHGEREPGVSLHKSSASVHVHFGIIAITQLDRTLRGTEHTAIHIR
jgi:hypothetical protein